MKARLSRAERMQIFTTVYGQVGDKGLAVVFEQIKQAEPYVLHGLDGEDQEEDDPLDETPSAKPQGRAKR